MTKLITLTCLSHIAGCCVVAKKISWGVGQHFVFNFGCFTPRNLLGKWLGMCIEIHPNKIIEKYFRKTSHYSTLSLLPRKVNEGSRSINRKVWQLRKIEIKFNKFNNGILQQQRQLRRVPTCMHTRKRGIHSRNRPNSHTSTAVALWALKMCFYIVSAYCCN